MKRLREFTRFCIKYDAPIAWNACAFMAAASTALGWPRLFMIGVALLNAAMSFERRLTGKQP